MTRNHLLIAFFSAVWLALLGIAASVLFPPTPLHKLGKEHEKFRQLLIALDVSERAYAAQIDALVTASHGIDYHTIYQGIDLNTIEGVQTARQRASAFGAQTEKFVAIHEQLWRQIKRIVDHNNLDEPYASQLKKTLNLDETDVYPKYRALIPAAREEVEADTHFLDVNEHYLGQFKRTGTSLTFSNPRVPQDLGKAQLAVTFAEEHYERVARAAFKNHGNTLKFVQSALRDLEKEIRELMSADQETDTEAKPQ